MSFIRKNEAFVCDFCQEPNPPALKTCRDHCYKCLFGQHVDDISPGDRASNCNGKMNPIAVLPGTRKSDYVILYKCERCGIERKNRMAPDDDFAKVLKIAERKMFG